MKEKIKQLITRLKARRRLRKITKAIGIKLTKRQKEVALNPDWPNMKYWGQGTGKTVTACIWTLMWRKKPIKLRVEVMKICRSPNDMALQGFSLENRRQFIPDPDAYTHTYLCFMHTWNRLYAYRKMCLEKKIKVFQMCGRKTA